ncbi:exonuclease domain-containing protein [Stomatohabitans albus]|uniref:exonuclease domain-containing protein n=1 Tax=Stomatohabitans albus TaxID=3110766 RepID=UPI00300C4CC0
MSLDFCAIDFETASWDRASAIQVGIVRVRDRQVVDQFATLLRPLPGFDEFSDAAIEIHHITPEMVAHAPYWRDCYSAVRTFIDEDRLVSYNARFDGQVFASTSLISGIDDASVEMGCALTWAQRTLTGLSNHRLATVAAHFGIELTNHHDATADAVACAQVVIHLATIYEVDSIDELARLANGQFSFYQADKKTLAAYLADQTHH